MNSFDAAVCAITVVAIVTGFKSGLLRSLATICGYVIAMPMAVSLTPLLLPVLSGKLGGPLGQDQLLFFVVFLAIGLLFAALFRFGVGELVGTDVSLLDRIAGALLGAARIALVAMTLVLIFDRIIPADRQPAFLRSSRLQPILLAAGRAGSNRCRRMSAPISISSSASGTSSVCPGKSLPRLDRGWTPVFR